MRLKAEYLVIGLTTALVLGAAFTAWHPAGAQVPACLSGDPTPVAVACPTPTAVPATATPAPAATATPLAVFPPRVVLYQDFSACGVLQVRASYEGTIVPFRVILTRNTFVLPLTQVDFFNSVQGILLSVPTFPGDVFRAFVFPQGSAPSPLPGTFFDAPAALMGQVIVNQVPPCPPPLVAPTTAPQVVIVTATPAAAPTQVLPNIVPPRTGDGGLVR